ncbi:ricin-type beta-trefoil lectin domain protein [Streptomyces ferralitis]|uniref:Ricin-type beta-trefoil lectin domain protein n=1 Tax=Streptantibioticus ferralitis TaxID=236510 RepID=A0ABT5ZC87_9ACTN|nr:ricin-type beta-trefoil lectin domain protein [Streptantibioticus ferralitis]MDF2261457.1 ricin-type beta-trefoil lectin domain protein [Streptantibioticus ferralitis]
MCMDVGGDHISNGSPVQIWTCNGTGAQVWRIIGQSLYNPQSGRCLDDPSGQIAQLQIWDCNIGGNANQNWDIVGYDGTL